MTATTAESPPSVKVSSDCSLKVPIEPLPEMTKEVVEEILNSQAPYIDEKQKETCKRMVEELSREDQEIAACTSYAYWRAVNFHEEPPSEEIRIRMAMREARRHLVMKHGKYANGLFSLRRAIAFRKEHNVDILRTCFPKCTLRNDTKETEKQRELYRSYILDEQQKQKCVVRGRDRGGRAVGLKFRRTAATSTTCREAYAAIQVYMTERALACTEYHTRGKEEKVCAVADFDNYSSSNAPPLMSMKECLKIGQQVYATRLQNIVVVEPTLWMKGVYYILSHLASASTVSKIAMAYGKQKEDLIRKYLSPENAMPFMLPDGELVSDVDIDHFLNFVPFHCLYDDV